MLLLSNVFVVVFLFLSFSLTNVVSIQIRSTTKTKDRIHLSKAHEHFQQAVNELHAPVTGAPLYAGEEEEDIFEHVRPLIQQQDRNREQHLSQVKNGEEVMSSLVETSASVGKVHAFCEICILVMQMKERGQPHLCAGLNPDYFVSCVENLESILRSDKAVVYWLRSGCMHLDREGPEIVKPCPAHAICAWVPNLFADVGIISPRNSLAPLCPRDFKYLPRIPRKPATATSL